MMMQASQQVEQIAMVSINPGVGGHGSHRGPLVELLNVGPWPPYLRMVAMR